MPKTKKKHQKGGRESLKKQFETMITLQKTYSKNLKKWNTFYQQKYGPLLTEAAELIDKFNDIPQKEMEDNGVKAVKKMVCEHICKSHPRTNQQPTTPTFGTTNIRNTNTTTTNIRNTNTTTTTTNRKTNNHINTSRQTTKRTRRQTTKRTRRTTTTTSNHHNTRSTRLS